MKTMSLLNSFKRLDRIEGKAMRDLERRLVRNYRVSLSAIRNLIAGVAYERYNGSWSAMMQYNRLGRLEEQIGKEVAKLTGKTAIGIKTGMAAGYKESFHHVAFGVMKESKVKLAFGLLREADVARAVSNPLDRVGFLKRNRMNQAVLTRQMQDILAEGLAQGKGYSVVGREISERMGVGANNAVRIARTEMHRSQQAGRMDSIREADEMGVKMIKVWSSSLDDVTREEHQDLDGQKREIDEDFEIDGMTASEPGAFGIAQLDINCRCSVRSEIKGYEPELRYRRDKLGKEGEVSEFTDYHEWVKDREERARKK